MNIPIIQKINNISIVRDDLLDGGSKSIIADYIIKQNIEKEEFVYATSVFGGFQIALSIYCKKYNKQAIIFTARRKSKHKNTLLCEKLGATIIEVFPSYLTVIQSRAKKYCENNPDSVLINFGALDHVDILGKWISTVINIFEKEPDEIWCSVGSGTLLSAILRNTSFSNIIGVQVGRDVCIDDERLILIKYSKPFSVESSFDCPFPSNPNYDRKAFEILIKERGYDTDKNILFFNVMA